MECIVRRAPHDVKSSSPAASIDSPSSPLAFVSLRQRVAPSIRFADVPCIRADLTTQPDAARAAGPCEVGGVPLVGAVRVRVSTHVDELAHCAVRTVVRARGR